MLRFPAVICAVVASLAIGTVSPVAFASPGAHFVARLAEVKPVPARADRAVSQAYRAPSSALAHPVALPAPASYRLSLPPAGGWTAAGGSGVSFAAAGTASPVPVTVQVLDAAAVQKLGLHGLVLRVTGTAGSTAQVSVAVPKSLLDGLYGADYAARVRWVRLPDCGSASCGSRAALASSFGALPPAVNAGLVPTRPVSASSRTALIAKVPVGPKPILLAAASGNNAADGSGNFGATSLSAAAQWQVSEQTGDFGWNYPLRTPPAAAPGPAPQLSLAYDAASVDGQTGATNNQTSAVGNGWDLTGGGYIERSYTPCSMDGGSTSSGDNCWKTDNATLVLAGRAQQLIKNAADSSWHLQSDDNTKVEHLTADTTLCNNGTYDSDCWRLTTTDGTQYYYGRNRLPGWDASHTTTTNSTWTEPVLGNNAGEPGFGSSCPGASSYCTQAWRWNLDYVVDPHGNSEALYYSAETNNYAENGSTTSSASYTRGGSLLRIDYGMRAGTELTASAPDQVSFTNSDRCETGQSGEPANACDEAHPVATYWPDVPWDQNCTSSNCGTNTTPTFWSIKRITGIQTRYWNGTSYVPVDSWSLNQSWPDPGDASAASMQLDQIAHSGLVGQTTTLPSTRFGYQLLQNRLAPPNGIVPLMKPRLQTIYLESGGITTVHYLASDCSATSPPTPQTNTHRCFPQYWAPPGRALALDWFEKYAVSAVNAAPIVGASPPTAGASTSDDVTSYDYSIGTPAWRFDTSPITAEGQRSWSDFAGYSKVRVKHGDTSLPSTMETSDTSYFQGLAGDIGDTAGNPRTPAPTLIATDGSGTTVTDSRWLAGQGFETKVYNGMLNASTVGNTLTDTVTTPYAFSATATAAALTEKIGTSSTTISATATARYSGNADVSAHTMLLPSGSRSTDVQTSYDRRGRAATVSDLGDTSTPADDKCTTTSYADNTSTSWRLSYPAEVRTVGVKCGTAPVYPDNAISDSRVGYDGQPSGSAPTAGNVTETDVVKDYDASHNPIWLTTSTSTYDALGRTLAVTDPLGHATSTVYTPGAALAGQPQTSNVGPVTQTVMTNPNGWHTTNTLNPAWGLATDLVDPNSHETSASYDGLGRRLKVWMPDRQPSASYPIPSVAYSYTTPTDASGNVNGPTAIATTTLTPVEGTTQTSYQLFDGLLRQRQTQSPAEGISQSTEFAAPGSNGSIVTDTLYDSAGRVATSNSPYSLTNAPSGTLWTPIHGQADIPGSTQTNYDGAGRAIASITQALGIEEWRISTAYYGDHVDVTPPAGGTATTTVSDARGNTTELAQYHGPSPVGLANPATYDATTYAYTPAGKLAKMTDPAGDVWSWTYDVQQRQKTLTDPETGTSTTSYDDANRVATSTDNLGAVLAYTYDNLNRKTGQYQNPTNPADPSTGSAVASWAYDSLASSTENGQLASSTSYTGSTPGNPGTAYTKSITGYDALDRPLGTTYTLPSVTGQTALAGSYTTTVNYNPNGSLHQQFDPAMGGLPAETIGNGYTSIGNPYSYGGQSVYLATTLYDNLARVLFVSHYNGAKRLEDTYTYSTDGTNRLQSATTTTAGTNNKIAGINYTYDPAGNLTSAINTPNNGPAVDTQCYSYDYLQRLTQAWTPTTGGCAASASSSNLGGPAPYWQNYTYSSTGNRLTATNHAITAAGTDQRDTYSYPTPGPAAVRPNAVSSINHATAPAGSSTYTSTGTDNYTYDADGNTKTAPGQTLSWGPTGKLATLTKTSQSQNRIYDADGNLLLQSDPTNGTTAYLGDAELHLAANGTTLTGQRTYTNLGRTIASRSATSGITGSTLTWLATDPQGTADITENPITGATTVRRTDPFGNNRGSSVTWPTDRGFLNAPADLFTGLTHLGARDYSPGTGKFLSVDPVLAPTDPQQNNGYSYAGNNPTSNSDPSGLRFACDSSQCDKNGNDHAPPVKANCLTGDCGNDPGPVSPPPSDSAPKTIQITAHVSVVASSPDAAKLAAAFAKYAASVHYLDGYGGTYAQAYNESNVWASFCNTDGADLCGGQVTAQWNEIYNTVKTMIPLGGDAAKTIRAINSSQMNQLVLGSEDGSGGGGSGGGGMAASAAVPIARIYVVTKEDGSVYVGQSGNIARRLNQHLRRNKFTQAEIDNARVIPVPGGKLSREIREQLAIDDRRQLGKQLLNERNPIGMERIGLMPQPYMR